MQSQRLHDIPIVQQPIDQGVQFRALRCRQSSLIAHRQILDAGNLLQLAKRLVQHAAFMSHYRLEIIRIVHIQLVNADRRRSAHVAHHHIVLDAITVEVLTRKQPVPLDHVHNALQHRVLGAVLVRQSVRHLRVERDHQLRGQTVRVDFTLAAAQIEAVAVLLVLGHPALVDDAVTRQLQGIGQLERLGEFALANETFAQPLVLRLDLGVAATIAPQLLHVDGARGERTDRVQPLQHAKVHDGRVIGDARCAQRAEQQLAMLVGLKAVLQMVEQKPDAEGEQIIVTGERCFGCVAIQSQQKVVQDSCDVGGKVQCAGSVNVFGEMAECVRRIENEHGLVERL